MKMLLASMDSTRWLFCQQGPHVCSVMHFVSFVSFVVKLH